MTRATFAPGVIKHKTCGDHKELAAKVTLPSRALVGGRLRYVPAAKTDIRQTFAKFQRLQRIEQLRTQREEGVA
jgi:hypothetical protein